MNNELLNAGHITSDVEKRRALLCGLRKDFSVIGKIIRVSNKSFPDAVSHLIVEESSTDEIDREQRALTSNAWAAYMTILSHLIYTVSKRNISEIAVLRLLCRTQNNLWGDPQADENDHDYQHEENVTDLLDAVTYYYELRQPFWHPAGVPPER